MNSYLRASSLVFAMSILVAFAPIAGAQKAPRDGKHVKSTYTPNAIVWQPKAVHRTASLRVRGPDGFVHEREFGPLEPIFDLKTLPGLVDGQYKFEVVFGLQPDATLAKSISGARYGEDGSMDDATLRTRLRSLRKTHSGAFRVEAGKILSPHLFEHKVPLTEQKAVLGGSSSQAKVVLTNGDGVIRNSLCVGFDCVDAPPFGDSTILMMENNTRIKFGDTSNAPFPNNDWEIEANSASSGGAAYLGFNDCGTADNDGSCSTDLVFAVEGGARANALYVESDGDVGIGTSNPVVDVHMVTGNTPTVRLDQDGSSGFTPQVWDVAGNETSFFIRDATNGSALPLRIYPATPSSMLSVAPQGVGVGLKPANWGNVFPAALQVKHASFIAHSGGGASYLVNNAYHDGAAWRTINTGDVSLFSLVGSTYVFLTAPGGPPGTAVTLTEKMRINNLGNVGIGTAAPTHRLHVVGNSKIEGTLQVTGGPVFPDYVFNPGFKIASIEENAAYMWKNRHLPAVGPAQATGDGKGVIDVYRLNHGMLEELEKAHIYIEKLNLEIKTLKAEAAARDAAIAARDATIRSELAALRQKIEK